MRNGVVTFLRKEDEYLLVLVEYSKANQKWNGIGGFVKEGESLTDAAIREVQEEIGVVLQKEGLEKVAVIQENAELKLHIFIASDWTGDIQLLDSSLKEFRWFVAATIPYDAMWPDNKYWLPPILEGKRITATVFKDVYLDIKDLHERDVEIQEVSTFP